ncbi:hypothetical protein T484DRAFT_1983337 [Baffinella frigidus]|nr:hypothetical protein T484DRAFT_1983337 [Cryptophyta sp. CCMP2293]
MRRLQQRAVRVSTEPLDFWPVDEQRAPREERVEQRGRETQQPVAQLSTAHLKHDETCFAARLFL